MAERFQQCCRPKEGSCSFAIHVYWEHKHLAPLFRDFGFETLEDFFSQELAQAARSSPVPTNTVKTTNLIVSIGSGSAMTWCAQQGGIFSECRRH